jgi:hypothetical protein
MITWWPVSGRHRRSTDARFGLLVVLRAFAPIRAVPGRTPRQRLSFRDCLAGHPLPRTEKAEHPLDQDRSSVRVV